MKPIRHLALAAALVAASLVAPATADAASGRCKQYEALLAQHPRWNVARMSRIMFRESRCNPLAYNGRHRDRSYGLLQINTKVTARMDLWSELQRRCGVTAREQLFDPATNVACAARLYAAYGMRPWAL